MFKHLLVPLDGSRMAEAALPIAAAVAARGGALLTLVHVIEKNAPAAVHSDRHLVNAEEAGAYLDGIAARPLLAGLRVETHVHTAEVRDVARSITEHAAEHVAEIAPDLVVMATHGRGGARRLFSGAMAQQVVAAGSTPVLLVRPPDSPERPAGVHPRPWKLIIAPIDGDPVHERSLPIAADLAAAFSCSLHLLMVTHTSGSLAGTEHAAGTFMPNATRIKLEMESAAAQEYLHTRARELSGRGIQTDSEATRGDPAQAIIKAARRLAPDLVVMATHGRAGTNAFFEGSVAARVITRARAPLLLVPVKD
jgi:nucleotide-binding universal stress UspA family protein